MPLAEKQADGGICLHKYNKHGGCYFRISRDPSGSDGSIYLSIDLHTYVCMYIYIYIYIYVERERERERERDVCLPGPPNHPSPTHIVTKTARRGQGRTDVARSFIIIGILLLMIIIITLVIIIIIITKIMITQIIGPAHTLQASRARRKGSAVGGG